MFQYRQVLVRLRQGDSDRDIARSRLMGRRKVAVLRALAAERGWLAPEAALPEDEAIATAVGQARRARSTISSAEPYRTLVERWAAQSVGGVAIHSALCREHGYRGSYSAVRRMLAGIRSSLPPDLTVPLTFAPAEAAQVDFGAGPFLVSAITVSDGAVFTIGDGRTGRVIVPMIRHERGEDGGSAGGRGAP